MQVVLDTNVLVSALLVEASLPAQLLTLWRQGRFTLLTAAPQLDELRRVSRYSNIRACLAPALAGRLINELQDLAVLVDPLPPVEVSPDPYAYYLLALAAGGHADYLVTGDKPGVLAFDLYAGTKIVTVRDFLRLTQRLP